MIYVTGDTHGNFRRFQMEYFPEQGKMTKDDVVIIAGDFGGVWFGDSHDDETLNWLENLPFTVAFVDGNHENFDALAVYPTEKWHGGKIQRIRPHVLHLMRGQVYELEGYRFFTMGGAKSHEPITESTISRGGHRNFPPMRSMPKHGGIWNAVAGRWTTSSPIALRRALPAWNPATTKQIGSQAFCKMFRTERNTITGCPGTTTTTARSTPGTSCCGS